MSKRPRRNSEILDNSDNLDELERELEEREKEKERERKGKAKEDGNNFDDKFDERCHFYNLDEDDINLNNNNKKDNKEIKSLFNKVKLELYDNKYTTSSLIIPFITGLITVAFVLLSNPLSTPVNVINNSFLFILPNVVIGIV